MKTNKTTSTDWSKYLHPPRRVNAALGVIVAALVAAFCILSPPTASAGDGGVGLEQCIAFETELLSLNLSGGPYPIPIGSDPGNTLFPDVGGGLAADGGPASIEGYAFVDCEVTITLSSQRAVDPGSPSLGSVIAFLSQFDEANANGGAAEGDGIREFNCDTPIDPEELDGQQFGINSFFDVFFDITVTDVDTRPGRDIAGAPHGASIALPDNGPANMVSQYSRIFDRDAPNYGLIPPPQTAPYIGHFNIEIPLGGDINGNGENDKVKFTIVSHAAGDENRTFTQLPDGTWIDEFDSAAFLAGSIVDESTDPPFTLGTGSSSAPGFGPGGLTGPTTASSTLLTPLVAVPDFQVDFNSTTQDGPAHNEPGYNAYDAAHENPGSFGTRNYATSFALSGATTVSVTPAWPNTTDNRVQQAIDRGAGNDANWVGDKLDLLTDFLGTDSRTGNGGNGNYDGVTGTPTWLTLTLGGLPAGSYDWRSFHHDTEHMNSFFTIELSTDGGTSFTEVHSGRMTDSTPGGNPDSLNPIDGSLDPDPDNLPSTANISFDAPGGDVILRFTPLAQTAVHQQFFGINGFELTQTAAADLGNGLVNYWTFDNNLIDCAHLVPGTASSVADDGSFDGANGTDGINYGSGLFGGAGIEQNGAGGGAAGQENDGFVRVTRSADTLYEATSTVTSSLWVRTSGVDSGWQTMFAHGEGSQYRIARRGGSNPPIAAYAGGSGDIPNNDTTGPPIGIDNGWHHVLAISEGGVSTRLWVDGSLVFTGGAPTIIDNGNNNPPNPDLFIGANPQTGANNREWWGEIDDVAQWNRVLSEVEIALLYGGGPATAVSLKDIVAPDLVAPEIFCDDKIVANAPAGNTATVSYGHIFAIDDVDGPIPVTCTPPDTTAFPIGSTTVTCTATDAAGNTTVATFDVCVLEIQDSPAARTLSDVSLRGEAAPGAAAGTVSGLPASATMFAYNHAFLNNSADVAFEATLSGAGSSNVGVFSNASGSLESLGVKNSASPAGSNYLAFKELALADDGIASFAARTSAGDAHVTDSGASTTLQVGSALPGIAGAPLVSSLFQAALDGSGDLFSPASLLRGSGTPVATAKDDTLIWSSTIGLVAREGDPAADLPTGVSYGHLSSRVVANDGPEVAFAGNLIGGPGVANAAVWSGPPTAPTVVARKGDTAPGTGGATFASFQAESISPTGTVVIRASLKLASGSVTTANNAGLWSDRSGSLALVAREDDLAPCEQPDVRFARFDAMFIDGSGKIVFVAFLKGAAVSSADDASVWRSDPDGSLHLIAREGQIANSTDGSVFAQLNVVAANNTCGVLISARLVNGIGDTVTANNIGVWRDDGAADPALVLVIRKGDTIAEDITVNSVSIDYVANAVGGTGGYGRVLNDSGTAVMRSSLPSGSSGVFTLPGSPPPG